MSAEIARQVNRADEPTRRRIAAAARALAMPATVPSVAGAAESLVVQASRLPVAAMTAAPHPVDAPKLPNDAGGAARFLKDAFDRYHNARKPDHDGKPRELRFTDDKHDENDTGAGKALTSFVTLCQSASFLARGRDQ